MEEIYSNLYVGDDLDYEKIADKKNWRSVRMCKYGPGGHQQTLDYHTLAAPAGKNYLFVEKPNRLAVNIIDMDDPNMIPDECILKAVSYAKEQLSKGFKVLICCNSGHSRGPSTGLATLRSLGDLPYHFNKAETIYRTLYPKYDPGIGMRQKLKDLWDKLGA